MEFLEKHTELQIEVNKFYKGQQILGLQSPTLNSTFSEQL